MLMKFNALFKKARDQKGFTLVELLVVMAILAVLAALAVPRFGQMLQDSRYKTHDENVAMIHKAGEMYVASNGNPSGAKTITDVANAGFLTSATIATPYSGTTFYTCAIGTDGSVTVTPGKASKNESTGAWTTATQYPPAATTTTTTTTTP